ncbi:unnamed protein product [Nesidiocoris tenuis]|uniref:Uncharacterized protein n=1 Tax=Nesidiocoris tenuis TaxID=355587 RepID=A0A6H5GNU0_9HEMI|nr:unnamed protein product [Nesidiocoris tenuis]
MRKKFDFTIRISALMFSGQRILDLLDPSTPKVDCRILDDKYKTAIENLSLIQKHYIQVASRFTNLHDQANRLFTVSEHKLKLFMLKADGDDMKKPVGGRARWIRLNDSCQLNSQLLVPIVEELAKFKGGQVPSLLIE